MELVNKVTGMFLAVGLAIFFVYACDDVEIASSQVATKELSAEMHVTRTVSSTAPTEDIITVDVMLRNGPLSGGQDVYLSDGDRLFASILGDFAANSGLIGDQFSALDALVNGVRQLREAEGQNSFFFNSGHIWYYGTFPGTDADKEFTIIMERPQRTDARNNVISLPPEFNITSPIAGQEYSHATGEDIQVMWDNSSSETMMVRAVYHCANGQQGDWAKMALPNDNTNLDPGMVTIPIADFPLEQCNVTIRVDRRKLGLIDANFTQGALALGHELRSVAVNLLP